MVKDETAGNPSGKGQNDDYDLPLGRTENCGGNRGDQTWPEPENGPGWQCEDNPYNEGERSFHNHEPDDPQDADSERG